MPSTLPYYWQLASASTEDRLSSSHALVDTLVSQQREANVGKVVVGKPVNLFNDGLQTAAVAQIDGKEVEEAEKMLEGHNCADVVYAMRRLMKGLASHRESSRLGFSVALCELIGQLKSITARHMTVLVLSYSSPSGKVKGQEERDLLFARLFGLYALIRSELVVNEELAQLEDFTRVVEVVWLLGRGKTWLRESSGWIITEAVRVLSASNAAWKEDGLRWLAKRVCDAKEVGPESVAIYATLQKTASVLDSNQTLPHLASPELLASANLASLARILKDGAGEDESAQNVASGAGRTQAHFVWDLLLQEYLVDDKSGSKKASFSEMYRVLIDEALFSSLASDQKKSWGFQVFERALGMGKEEDLAKLFTPNLMRTWMNQLADKNRMLHKAAQRCVSKMQMMVREKPSLGVTLVSQLVGKNGNVRFDAITGTKTVESILACMDVEGVQTYVGHLFQQANSGKGEENETTRKWVLDQLHVIVRNASIPTSDDCVSSILSYSAAHGFFSMKDALEDPPLSWSGLSVLPKPSFSPNAQSICRARFLSCLGEVSDQLSSHVNEQGKVKRVQGQMANGQSWVSSATAIVEKLESDRGHFIPLSSATSDEAVLRGREFSRRVSRARAKTDDEKVKGKMQDLQSMVLAGLLYSGKDLDRERAEGEGLDEDWVDSLIECGSRLVLGKKTEKGEPSAVELLVHCLVSFLKQSSAFLRSIATQTFASFTDEMNREGLGQLIEHLGFNETADGEEVEEEEEEQGGEEEEEDVMSDSVSETSATSASSSQEGQIDPVLVAKLQEVLKAGGAADSDAGSSSDDDESEAESQASGFNDDQMMLIDDKLADIFRQKLGAQRGEERAKKEAIELHIKILDLLDVFARKQSNNPLVAEIVLPLFTIALEKDAAMGQLKQRASNVLIKTLCKSKESPSGVLLAEAIIRPMEAVHAMASSKLPLPAMNLCSTVNVYLTKACEEHDLLHGKVFHLYASTLRDFTQRKSSNLRPQFFLDVFQRLPLLGFSLRDELLAAASGPQQSAKQSYRQLQSLEMLRTALVHLGGSGKEIDNLVAFLPQLSQLILATVSNEKLRLKEIIKVGLDLARLTKKVCKSEAEVAKIWPEEQIEGAMEAVGKKKELANSVSLQALLRQLLAVTSAKSKDKGGRVSDSVNGKRASREDQQSKEPSKKKRSQ